MRAVTAIAAFLVLLTPQLAAAATSFSCSQIPDAQRFVDKLQPGPNTSAAQTHLDVAKHAGSEQACVAELRQVDKYARRSAAADKRKAAGGTHHVVHHVRCADVTHQDRPGGTDYRGPPVAACPQQHF